MEVDGIYLMGGSRARVRSRTPNLPRALGESLGMFHGLSSLDTGSKPQGKETSTFGSYRLRHDRSLGSPLLMSQVRRGCGVERLDPVSRAERVGEQEAEPSQQAAVLATIEPRDTRYPSPGPEIASVNG